MDNSEDEPLPRVGMRWSAAEEDRLLDAVGAGTPIETLMADFGRTKGALTSRARRMLPFDHPGRQDGDAIAELHQLLTNDPAYRPPVSIREELRQRRNRPWPRGDAATGTDHSPSRTLPGNPHADAADFVEDLSYPAAALREALLAIAYELRTANLIAAAKTEHGALDDREVVSRLGRDDADL